MHKEKKEIVVQRPGGKPLILPDNMPSEAVEFIKNTYNRATTEFAKSDYGHAALALATSVIGAASLNIPLEQQRDFLRESALEKIQQFGKAIIPLLRDELKLALTDGDLISMGINPEEIKSSK